MAGCVDKHLPASATTAAAPPLPKHSTHWLSCCTHSSLLAPPLLCSYPIEELAAEGDFIDSTFLLLHGELPSKQEKQLFEREIKYHTLVGGGRAGCAGCGCDVWAGVWVGVGVGGQR